MEIYPDFKELLELFNARKVEYVVVGGYAAAHHGLVRATGDIDLYVRPSSSNAERIMAALDAFGFGQVGLTQGDFEQPGQVIQLGVPPVRIDIITSITGVAWEDALSGLSRGEYGGTPVPFIGRDELIANKTATGRLQDLADAERLTRQTGADEGR